MTYHHGDLTETCYIPRATGVPVSVVEHTSLGIKCEASDDSMSWARFKAWREMAMKLSQRLTCLNNVTSPDGPTLRVTIKPTPSLTSALENCPDGESVRIDEL